LKSVKSRNSLRHPDTGLRLIAVFKLVKGLLLLALGLGAATLLRKNAADSLRHWADVLSVIRENRYVNALLYWFMGVNRRTLRTFEISTLIYSALLLTEGFGLLLLKRWAEYLTVIVTASFIPLELLSDVSRFSIPKTIILLINSAVVGYLCSRLWGKHPNT